MIEFVETSVSRRIHNTVELAQTMNTNAAIIGAPGVGKTMALTTFEARNRGVLYLTISPILSGSIRGLMEALCKKIDFYIGGKSIYEIERAISRHDFGDWTFIIDEAKNLPLKSLQQLLHFSPEDGGTLKFIFCGNNEVLKRGNTDQGAFAQISRRVRFREVIDTISETDADTLTNAFGVEGLDAYSIMRAIGKRFQADGVVQVLKVAKRLAGSGTVKATHIESALSGLTQYRSALEAKPRRRKAG